MAIYIQITVLMVCMYNDNVADNAKSFLAIYTVPFYHGISYPSWLINYKSKNLSDCSIRLF